MIARKKIKYCFSYLLLLAVYSAFFTVQLTANFDIPGNSPSIAAKSFNQILQQNPAKTGVSQSQAAYPKRVIIRLNKRFHPEFAPACPVVVSAAPLCFILTPVIGHYTEPHFSLISLSDQSQRGPPVVA